MLSTRAAETAVDLTWTRQAKDRGTTPELLQSMKSSGGTLLDRSIKSAFDFLLTTQALHLMYVRWLP
jgi:hypothetical protein